MTVHMSLWSTSTSTIFLCCTPSTKPYAYLSYSLRGLLSWLGLFKSKVSHLWLFLFISNLTRYGLIIFFFFFFIIFFKKSLRMVDFYLLSISEIFLSPQSSELFNKFLLVVVVLFLLLHFMAVVCWVETSKDTASFTLPLINIYFYFFLKMIVRDYNDFWNSAFSVV